MLLLQLIDVISGLEMTLKEFQNILDNAGFKKLEIKKGDEFNPNTMEAIDQKDNGKNVIEIYSCAYKLHDKIVKPARVKVGNKH